MHKGKFNPVISDGRYLFLNGQTSLFAYDLRPGKGPVEEVPGDRPKLKPPKRDRERLARERKAQGDAAVAMTRTSTSARAGGSRCRTASSAGPPSA